MSELQTFFDSYQKVKMECPGIPERILADEQMLKRLSIRAEFTTHPLNTYQPRRDDQRCNLEE